MRMVREGRRKERKKIVQRERGRKNRRIRRSGLPVTPLSRGKEVERWGLREP
jgi:hypothetical protein